MNTPISADTPMPIDLPVDSSLVVPLLAETLEIGRARHETGAVRVRVLVDETTTRVPSDASVDEVTSTRVARGILVDARREPWNDGDVLVVPIYEEVLVTERRLMLKEEVHITRRTLRTSETLDVPLRRERAVVERRRPDGVWISEES